MSSGLQGRRGTVRSGAGRAGRGVNGAGPSEGAHAVGRGRGRAMSKPDYQSVSPKGSPPAKSSPDRLSPNLSTDMSTISLNAMQLSERPGFGRVGRPIPLRSNHFEINFPKGSIVVQHYDVEVTHQYRSLNKEEMRSIFWRVVGRNKSVFQPYSIAYDGGKQVFCTDKLQFDNNRDEFGFEVDILLDRDDRQSRCSVKFRHVAQVFVDLTRVTDFNSPENTPLQVIDCVFRQGRLCPNMQSPFIPAGRSFFAPPRYFNDPPEKTNIGFGREIWRGFFSASHVCQDSKPLLNIDTSNTAFYRTVPVIEYMCDILSKLYHSHKDNPWYANRLNPGAVLKPLERQVFIKEVKNLRVFVTHRGPDHERRLWRVMSVTDRSAQQLTFTQRKPDNEEHEMSVADYFAQAYAPLRFPNLPCLQVGSRSRHYYLPLEVCSLKEGQKCNKKLKDEQTSNMIRNTCVDAPTRERRINEMINMANFQEDPWVSSFGMGFRAQMAEMTGRILPTPMLQYARRGTYQNGRLLPQHIPGHAFSLEDGSVANINVRDGAWRADNEEFYVPAEIKVWCLLSFMRQDTQRQLETFCAELQKHAVARGIRMSEWPKRVEYIQRYEQIVDCMRKMVEISCEDDKVSRNEMLIVVAMTPNKDERLYAEVKRVGDIVLGVPTQCVAPRNITKCSPMTVGNILLKINMKMRGVNNRLKPDELNKHFFNPDSPTLILGVDVTHPGPLDKRSPSIAAVVGNIDVHCTRFCATVKVQKHRNEPIVYLLEPVRERLAQFYQQTKLKPKRIIVYRDGVSAGQFKKVLRDELKGVMDACTALNATYKPQITFVVVQKRHHTRFFCRNSADMSGRGKNVPAGTTVDTGIVHPTNNDFFQCSHFGIQGTSCPAHYFVLHDDSKMPADIIQQLTFQLCHCYQRCPRSVSIPAPVYYGSLVVTRARLHIRDKVFQMESDSSSTSDSGARGDMVNSNTSSTEDQELIIATTLSDNFADVMYFM